MARWRAGSGRSRRATPRSAHLLGGKGANLAEMTRLGLPIPPGFTVTTDACRAYLGRRRVPPTGSGTRSRPAWRRSSGRSVAASATPPTPLLVSVRSGAAASMPGMMETVLNLGLNAATVAGLAAQAGDDRFAWDSFRRLIQMYGRVVLGVPGERFESRLAAHKRRARRGGRRRPRRADPGARGRRLPRPRARGNRPGVSRRSLGPAAGRGRGRLPVVEHRARRRLPARVPDPRRPRHRGHRPGDGLRQPRRRLRHRRRLHPRPGHRRAAPGRRVPAQRPGRGRGGGHPDAAPPRRHGRRSPPGRGVRGAAEGRGDAGGALRRRPGPGVHDRAGPALDAADAGGQTHRPRRRPHRRRHGSGGADRSRHRGPPRPARASWTNCSTRRSTRPPTPRC